MAAERLIRAVKVDEELARHIVDNTSLTRAALNGVLPKTTAAPASIGQWVTQRVDGSWRNPVRDDTVGGRIYVGYVDTRAPVGTDGLQAGDIHICETGVRIATFVPATGQAQWKTVQTPGGGGTPTDPTTPTVPGDTSAAAPTARPYALLASTGTWSSPAGTTLVQALSEQDSASVTGTPTTGSSGLSLTLDMGNFAHADGNDLVVTLWATSTSTAGDVSVVVGFGSQQYVAPLTKPVGGGGVNLAFVWPRDAQLALPSATWRDVEVTIFRSTGDLTLSEVTIQSQPVTTAPPAGTDPTDPVSIRWASNSVWYSNVTSAPASKVSAQTVTYVRGQVPAGGGLRLDCYSDAAPIWMVPGSTPRINITPPASSTRGDVALMRRTDGKGALDGVPIPADMPAPSNMFATAVVACPETRQLWELLGLTKSGTAWSASWGGRIDEVPTNGGVFPTSTGYTGSGLAWAASAVKVSEARDAAAGNVNAIGHAVGLNLNYSSASTRFTWPATRSDGTSSDAGAPRMGQRLRLKASADLSQCTPVGKAVGQALKTYGAVIMGGSDKISIIAESGAGEQLRTGNDPWGAILQGKSVDNVLAGLPLDQLEAVSPGWGGPNWAPESDTTTPTTPTTPPVTGTNRRAIYMPTGATWLSGASCRAVEDQADGMGSTFASWRGEPCHMSRTWADRGGPNDNNDPKLWPLVMRFANWHASMDEGPGFFGRSGESMSAAASGSYDARWEETLRTARNWWATRRDPSKVNFFYSPAHEFNGNWYPWSVNSGNYTRFITAWKRLRAIQLRVFPEALLCLNANAQSIGANMDWRRMVPGYAEGKVKDFVDVGGCDYYNFTSVTSDSSWNTHINRVDQWGGPWGLEKHRQFWESCGLPMQIPEWSNHKPAGDSPMFATKMNEYMRLHAGTGPGKICADALFNLSSGYEGQYAVYGDTVGSPNFAAAYRSAYWGR